MQEMDDARRSQIDSENQSKTSPSEHDLCSPLVYAQWVDDGAPLLAVSETVARLQSVLYGVGRNVS